MGCGCNNNFNAAKKPCTCGRNAGGNCQCNERKLNVRGGGEYVPLPPCYICEEPATFSEPDERGTINQLTGCHFDENGKVIMRRLPNNFMTSVGVRENCPSEGYNSDNIFVSSNPSSSNNNNLGSGSGNVSNKTPRPKRPKKLKQDSLAKRLVNQKKQFSKFMGEEYFPQVNVREFGFDGDSYYEFNDKYSMYRGINKSDLITDF